MGADVPEITKDSRRLPDLSERGGEINGGTKYNERTKA